MLVTGAAGLLGGVLLKGLADTHSCVGLDIVKGPGVDVVTDLRRRKRLATVITGMSAVVDLAANARLNASWESVVDNNIAATLNVLDAARTADVPRVILASSNHVVGLAERDEPYASVVVGRYDGLDPASLPRLLVDTPIRADSPYGVGKAFAEVAGRYYAEQHGLSVICLRIGSVYPGEGVAEVRDFATLLTHRDLVQLVERCLAAPPSLRFGVYYGVSANTWRIWDIDAARVDLGYVPVDDAERWRER